MMTTTTRRARRRSAGRARRAVAAAGRAFSLIEILIAVMVLALGLLGLGAVFPVIIREQRLGSDATFGVLAANSVQTRIEGMLQLNRAYWTAVSNHNGMKQPWITVGGVPVYHWLVPPTNNNTGLMPVGPGGGGSLQIEIPLAERLYPVYAGDRTPPQFVWDIALQRVDRAARSSGTAELDRVRIAVFVRRLDPGIRVPPGQTLPAMLLANPPAVLPVGIGTGQGGIPTYNGTGIYSRPRVAEVRVEAGGQTPARLERRRLSVPSNATGGFLAQIGQRFIDCFGDVYRVEAIERDGNRTFIIVDRPVPTEASDRVEVVLTPQVPAAVHVFEVSL